jgi:FkbM family methyltransferase
MARFSVGLPAFVDTLVRYLLNRGRYPHTLRLRTPAGILGITLYSYHDLLTVNEVFFRQDYRVRDDVSVIVDIGANIGISALYFLSRNTFSYIYLFEPSPVNIPRLRENLKAFSGRYTLYGEAISTQTGIVPFGVEPTGRYGALGKDTGHIIDVPARAIQDVLAEILDKHEYIDALKIDTEGTEVALIQAIPTEIRKRIGCILYESIDGPVARLAGLDGVA